LVDRIPVQRAADAHYAPGQCGGRADPGGEVGSAEYYAEEEAVTARPTISISTLIEQLAAIRAEHGDLPVYYEYDGMGLTLGVELEDLEDPPVKIVVICEA
jgi:hypothetical protein